MTGDRWSWIGGAILGAFGVVSIAIGARNALRPEQSQDLAPVFRAARLWLAGANPYAPVSLDVWRAETGSDDAPDTLNGPDQSSIYSPIAVMDVAAVSGRSWLATKQIWLALNLGLAAYVPWLIWRVWYRHWPGALTWLAVSIWMGGMGLRIGLGNGQHALVWLALVLTSCAVLPSWPRAAGAVLALSVHKFNLTAMVTPYFVAKRAVVALISAAAAIVSATALFLIWGHTPAMEIVESYGREFAWLFEQSRGGTLPGHGLTDLYSVLAGLTGEGRLASIASFGFAAAGLVVTFVATRGRGRAPRDVEVAAWLLFVLWTSYHRAYDTVLLVVPLAVLMDRAWRAVESGEARRRIGMAAALALMWYVDPSKLYTLVHPTALDRMPTAGGLVVLEMIYRIGVLAVWASVVAAAARERRLASGEAAVQADWNGADKTTGVVCGADGDDRMRRVTRVVIEGATA